MTQPIHFEQLSEELRIEYPQAQTIWATENPLAFCVDGIYVPLEGRIASHRPVWINASPTSILADGITASTVRVTSPSCPNQVLRLRFRQGNQAWMEDLTLDGEGNAEIEVVAETAGEIQVDVVDTPVHLSLIVASI